MTIATQLPNDLETRLKGYAVGDHFEQFIRRQIEAGHYASADEIVREALRLLETQERLREIELEEYREKIREGIASGPAIPADEVFARLEAKYQGMIDQQA
jgi:antitoxin ParD1/3/4